MGDGWNGGMMEYGGRLRIMEKYGGKGRAGPIPALESVDEIHIRGNTMTDLPSGEHSIESNVVRCLAQNPLVYALGLLVECPQKERRANCPLHEMDGLSFAEKVDALQAMAPSKLSEWLQHHIECMAQGGMSIPTRNVAPPNSKLFVLLAEDDPHTRFSLELTLKRAGHRVKVAENADSLLAVLASMTSEERGRVDLLVTDLNMPGKNGEDLICELDGLGRMLPVVVITAYGSAGVEAELRRRGHVTILNKPFHPDELVSAVNRTCARYEEETKTKESP